MPFVYSPVRVLSSTASPPQPVLDRYRRLVQDGQLKADVRQIALAEKLDKLGALIDKYHQDKSDHQKRMEKEERENAIRRAKVEQESAAKAVKAASTETEAAHLAGNEATRAILGKPTLESPAETNKRSAVRIPRGLYIHGNVGTGKTMLMDIFFDSLRVPRLRVHLHEFLQDIHARIHRDRKSTHSQKRGARAAIEDIGKQLAREYSTLAFDEFFVTDAADAAILEVLLEAMMNEGIVLLATSNVDPADLHESFAGFLPKFLSHCKVHDIESDVDYREASMDESELTMRPFHIVTPDPMGTMNEIIQSHGARIKRDEPIDCGFGRCIQVPFSFTAHSDDDNDGKGVRTAMVPFQWLCGSKHPILGPNEYNALCRSFDRIVIGDVPLIRVQPGRVGDESRRFGTFMDIAYDAGTEVMTISQHDELFVVDEDIGEDAGQTPESIASLRSFIRARSRWQQLSRGERQARQIASNTHQ